MTTTTTLNGIDREALSATLDAVRATPALAQVSAGPGLVAVGALAILLAAIESAGLRHLWPAGADGSTAAEAAP